MPELDGVRGLAISAVMALHFLYVLEPEGWVQAAISKIAGYGLWGVDLFFVLSGFLITGILYDAKGGPGYFKNFYMRRTLRIFPLYYGVLFVLLVLTPKSLLAAFDPQLLETRSVQSWLWTYLSNVYVGRSGEFSIPYVSHFWSLAVEEHFYLFWPFLIAYLPRRGAMAACLSLSALALALRIGLSIAGHTLYQQVLTPCRLDTLCLGAFMALLVREPGGLARYGLLARRWLPIVGASIVLLSVLQKASPDPLTVEIRGSVLAVFFGLLILTSADPSGVPLFKRVFRVRWLGTLGKYSYGLYVFHGLIAYAFDRRQVTSQLTGLFGSHTIATLVQAAAGIGLSLAIAVASYELYEARFLSLRKLFRHGRPDKLVASPSPARAAAPEFKAQADLGSPTELATTPRAAARFVGRGPS